MQKKDTLNVNSQPDTGKIQITHVLSEKEISLLGDVEQKEYFEDLINKANSYAKSGEFDSAISLVKEIKDSFGSFAFPPKDSRNRQATISHNLGTYYWQIGKLTDALYYFQEALRGYIETEDEISASSSYNNIGLVYWNQWEIELAMINLTKSVTISKKYELKERTIESLNNIAILQSHLGHFENAYTCLSESISLSKLINNELYGAIFFSNISLIESYLGSMDQASQSLKSAFKVFHKLDNLQYMSQYLDNQAKILMLQGQFNNAHQLFLEATGLKLKYSVNHEISESYLFIILNLHYANSDELLKYYHKLLELSRSSSNNIVNLHERIARSIMSSKSTSWEGRYHSMQLLKEIKTIPSMPFELYIHVLIHLVDLLFFERKCAESTEEPEEIYEIIEELSEIDKRDKIPFIQIPKLIFSLKIALHKLKQESANAIWRNLRDLIDKSGIKFLNNFIYDIEDQINKIKTSDKLLKPMRMNSIIHSEARLNILFFLIQNPNSSFSELKDYTHYSSGKLISHCNKLEEVGYIKRSSSFAENGAISNYDVTTIGLKELRNYSRELSSLYDYFDQE